MFKEPKIIFHHIPKCGGTSIVTGLALSYYPVRLLLKGKDGFAGRLHAPLSSKMAEFQELNRYTLRRTLLKNHIERETCPFISGHYPFDPALYEQYKNEWNFITLLRDPLIRWYSEYFWNRYKDHDYRKTELSIEDYLETQEGLENTRSFINYFSLSERTSQPVTEEEKNEAIKNLSRLTVIGFLDDLDQFKQEMKSVFGRKPFLLQRNKSPAANKHKKLPDKGSDFEKKILGYLEADIEIYRKARELKGL